jgi:hypothetical protein
MYEDNMICTYKICFFMMHFSTSLVADVIALYTIWYGADIRRLKRSNRFHLFVDEHTIWHSAPAPFQSRFLTYLLPLLIPSTSPEHLHGLASLRIYNRNPRSHSALNFETKLPRSLRTIASAYHPASIWRKRENVGTRMGESNKFIEIYGHLCRIVWRSVRGFYPSSSHACVSLHE